MITLQSHRPIFWERKRWSYSLSESFLSDERNFIFKKQKTNQNPSSNWMCNLKSLLRSLDSFFAAKFVRSTCLKSLLCARFYIFSTDKHVTSNIGNVDSLKVKELYCEFQYCFKTSIQGAEENKTEKGPWRTLTAETTQNIWIPKVNQAKRRSLWNQEGSANVMNKEKQIFNMLDSCARDIVNKFQLLFTDCF